MPWDWLATSAISVVYYLTQLIYSKPYIRIFSSRKKLRVKLLTFNAFLQLFVDECDVRRIFDEVLLSQSNVETDQTQRWPTPKIKIT